MTGILTNILEWIYGLVNSYGVAVILFTLLVRLVLMPLEVKSRKGMRKMAEIQPKLNALQQKYANDKQKLQQKQTELMKKENYNPMSGCLPLLLQWPILFCMFYAMRDIANEKIIEQAFLFLQGETPVYEGFLWIKNVFMPDSPFKSIAADASALYAATSESWQNVFNTLSAEQLEVILGNIRAAVPAAAELTAEQIFTFAKTSSIQSMVDTYLIPAMQQMPAYIEQTAHVTGWKNVNLLLASVTVFKSYNGLLILPILSGVTQWMMTKFGTGAQPEQTQQQQNGGMNAFMKYFFPVFSVFICLTSNAGFALYWVTINVFATVQTIGINKYLDHKDAVAAKAASAGEGKLK